MSEASPVRSYRTRGTRSRGRAYKPCRQASKPISERVEPPHARPSLSCGWTQRPAVRRGAVTPHCCRTAGTCSPATSNTPALSCPTRLRHYQPVSTVLAASGARRLGQPAAPWRRPSRGRRALDAGAAAGSPFPPPAAAAAVSTAARTRPISHTSSRGSRASGCTRAPSCRQGSRFRSRLYSDSSPSPAS